MFCFSYLYLTNWKLLIVCVYSLSSCLKCGSNPLIVRTDSGHRSSEIYQAIQIGVLQPTQLKCSHPPLKPVPLDNKPLHFLPHRFIKKIYYTMALRLPSVLAKQRPRRSLQSTNKSTMKSSDVPKGFVAVYVGEVEKKRFMVLISYLN